ncbi:MAG: hypothetical protein ACMVO5_03880 [Polymorphobacter sp.]|uniref:hypothetical protein n=1 Tax=Polymorphobacter sp. TaxID=1909290 RepID=UPI003A88EB8A
MDDGKMPSDEAETSPGDVKKTVEDGPLWLSDAQREAIAETIGGAPRSSVEGANVDDEPSAGGASDTLDDAARVEDLAGRELSGVAAVEIDDGSLDADEPLREVLLQLGYLTIEQAERVRTHAAQRELEFDRAALELGYITPDDLDRARELLITSMAQRGGARRPVSDELVVVSEPLGLRAELVRLLRTQVIAQHVKAGRRGLATVSAVPAAGCSNLVANLAVALSQVGIKTLLVDANLRDPRQHEIFGLDRDSPGLSTYLSMKVTRPERVVQANVLPSLAVITAGPAVSRPQELLSSRRFREGVNMLLREYDLVLFDTPPANSSADALTIGAAAGYVMVVARRDHGFFKDISVLVEQLQASRCKVIGSVLNEF